MIIVKDKALTGSWSHLFTLLFSLHRRCSSRWCFIIVVVVVVVVVVDGMIAVAPFWPLILFGSSCCSSGCFVSQHSGIFLSNVHVQCAYRIFILNAHVQSSFQMFMSNINVEFSCRKSLSNVHVECSCQSMSNFHVSRCRMSMPIVHIERSCRMSMSNLVKCKKVKESIGKPKASLQIC